MRVSIIFFLITIVYSCGHNNISFTNYETGLNINFIKFTLLEGTDSPKSKFMAVEVYNNQNIPVFLYDSLMYPPDMIYFYDKDNKSLGASYAENYRRILVEVPANAKDTFYIPPRFRSIERDASVFEFIMCYHLSPVYGEKKECQKLKYKIEGDVIEKIE